MNQSRLIDRVSQVNTKIIENFPTVTTIDTTQQIPIARTAVFGRTMPISNPVANMTRPVSIYTPPRLETNLFPVQGILPRNSRVVVQNQYTVHPPVQLIKQQSIVKQTTITDPILARVQTQAVITPVVFESTSKQRVRGYQKRQNIELRQGFCLRLSNSLSSSGPGCLRCIPCWLLILLSLLFLAGLIFTAFHFVSNYHGECRQGLHFFNGKCYGCPFGSQWDGQNCIKSSLVVKGETQSQTNGGGILNQETEYPGETNFKVDKTVINTAETPHGRQQRISRLNKLIQQKDITVHHLRHKL